MHFRVVVFLAALCFSATYSTVSSACITVQIRLSQQTMNVYVDGAHLATWPVSTARPGYRTPEGTFQPYVLEKMHYSRLYDYTPMPHSMFFHGNFAIHGTSETRNLGRPVSHGCVRLRRDNDKALFDLVSRQGREHTTITITQ